MTIPVKQADEAFEAHAALIKAETPELARNPYWKALRDAAFARFRAALEAV